jgi:glucosamine--fructose-6-phosphate aminotransferase (isomerizing)
MCGIIGYTGNQNATDIIYKGLQKLEYRGYDSSGIAAQTNGTITLMRAEGKLKNLRVKPVFSGTGIGHTRWATHGKPCVQNAHPHTDCTGKIAVVHNGIIENYAELKKELQAQGHVFKSQTDTEVLAHLIEKYFKGNLTQAVSKTLKKVRGSYAIGAISADDEGTIVCARKDSPLILGIGEGENFLASDIAALLGYVREMIFLEDFDIAEITPDKITIFNAGKKVTRKSQNIMWNAVSAEKDGYKHFMLKEINEQPQTVQDTLAGQLLIKKANFSRICIAACGTSYHAALIGKLLFENISGIPAQADTASEFRYSKPILSKNDLVIVISQSGETADTLAALRLAKKLGAKTLGICNVRGSSISREADDVIYTHCGPEIGVASTKAFTGQLSALYMLAFNFALSPNKALVKELNSIPAKMNAFLKETEHIEEIAKQFSTKHNFLYLGRNINFPIALEGALKLKELSYIHAEGYPAGEMKHGPIALIDANMPVIAIAPKGATYEKMLSNIEEVKTRGASVIAIATKGDKLIKTKTDYQIFVPETDEILSPLLTVLPLQLFAYHTAAFLGCDIDQPRNLAKSVTVE